jgi:hypothetical protein
MTPAPHEARQLRSVIRGERSWLDLREIGICVTMDADRCQIDNPRHLSTCASLEDLAAGVKTLAGSPESLQRWAWFVLAASSLFEVEGDSRGEPLLAALWDLAFRRQLDPRIAALASDLLDGRGV